MDSDSHSSAEDRRTTPAIRPRRGRRLLVLLALAAAATGTVWSAYAWYRNRSASPPIAPPSLVPRFLNTRLGVAYVGSPRCGECHAAEAATYAEHPMGRSVSPASRMLPTQDEAERSFEASGLRYAVERRDEQVWHRELLPRGGAAPAVEIAAETTFAIGSGRQGQSFLINREGRFFQSPISWFVHANTWNLSPGFARHNQHFSRTIGESCLFCHANEAHGKADTINQFEPEPLRLEAIGCERCHGPGALHVAAHDNGAHGLGVDRTIVNPRRLTPQLREAVCEQCHLQGEARIVRAGTSLWNYRPGLALDNFVSVFVRPPRRAGNHKAVSHVEQMHQSRCFQASAGKMGCISCHDPHVLPSERERVAWYRGRCLNCHRESSCRLSLDERHRRTSTDSCIDCHMPRGDSSNIAHTSITDHRIVRRPAPATADDDADLSLVPFHSGMVGGGDAASRRDLGLALVEMTDRADSEARRRQLAVQACNLLKPAIERQPGDVAALEALGQALWKDKRPRPALDSLDQALQRAPRRELALQSAALVALELNETERSIAYWKRLLELNPYTWQSHAYYGQALALRREWSAASDACRAALRLNPFESRTRMLRIDCLIHQGERQRARAEFETLLALRPSPPAELRRWFDELMNGGR
jgi:hypothetical protein